MTDDTSPLWLADLLDANDEPRPSLLRDFADWLYADRLAILVALAVVAGLLLGLFGGLFLYDHSDPSWVAAHPVWGGR